MATTVALRKILDRKQWERVSTPPYIVTATSGEYAVAQSTQFDQYQLWATYGGGGINVVALYDPREDAWGGLPSSGMSLGALTSATYHPSGPTGTASAGGATTITTTLTLPGSLAGYTIRLTGGTGAGQERTITSNTYGANAVITVSSPWATQPDATTAFLLLTGRFWLIVGSTFKYYDLATNVWSAALSTTGLSVTSSPRIAATPAYGNTIATGTATAGSTTTLTNSGKAWTTNQWSNYQIRITAGTGAGQVRTVASNTATVLTVSSAFGTAPDATSVYMLEPNDDYLYLQIQNNIALYRYSISGNTWTALTPGAARTAAPSFNGTLTWTGIVSDSSWADETNIKNGRYLYSFQGGGTANLSYYDIAANTWVNLTTTYQRASGSGASYALGVADMFISSNSVSATADREYIYLVNITPSMISSNMCWRYNCVTQSIDAWTVWPFIPPVNPASGTFTSVVSYTDGGTTLRWLYVMPFQSLSTSTNANSSAMFRMLII